jgi:hypothetical protein
MTEVSDTNFSGGRSVVFARMKQKYSTSAPPRLFLVTVFRHIERTRVLAYIVDASGTSAAPPPQTEKTTSTAAAPSSPKGAAALGGWDPAADLRALQRELWCYDPNLPARPSIVIANKMDVEGAERGLARLRVRPYSSLL